MKTSVTMIRRMGEFEVLNRTKDGMFNATHLLKQWNKSPNINKKELGDFFKNKATKEFIEAIEEDSKDGNSPYLKTRGKYGGTWMNPYLFIDFAMWLNPKFKLQVIKFVSDQLLEFRNDSGDLTKELNSSVQRFSNINYPQLAKGINHITFGKHKKEIRNTATEKELKSIVDLQKKLAFACDMGYIDSFEKLMEEMRRLWSIRK